jgi:hypothetical protein
MISPGTEFPGLIPVDTVTAQRALHVMNRSKPYATICGIELRVCDPRALPKGVSGVMVDPNSPENAVWLRSDPCPSVSIRG